jgi:hypothetical protein
VSSLVFEGFPGIDANGNKAIGLRVVASNTTSNNWEIDLFKGTTRISNDCFMLMLEHQIENPFLSIKTLSMDKLIVIRLEFFKEELAP